MLEALASGFDHLAQVGLLGVTDARQAAAQFAYLVAGEPLDRAVLTGTIPPREHLIACAREGVPDLPGAIRARRRRAGRRRQGEGNLGASAKRCVDAGPDCQF